MKKKVSFSKDYGSNDAYVKRFDASEISFPIHPVFKVIGVLIVLFLIINPFSDKFFGFWNMKYINGEYSSQLGNTKAEVINAFGLPTEEKEAALLYENCTFTFNEKGKCTELTAPADKIFKTDGEPTVKYLQDLFKSAGKLSYGDGGIKITEYNFIKFRAALYWENPMIAPQVKLYK